MDDTILQKVCTLSTALRHSAHLLLDHQHKLSLDTWTLSEIQEAFNLILEIEQHTNFHVLPANHRQHPAIPHLQFIYDLLQKIFGLRLWAAHGQSIPQNETINLRCFRNLQALELDHVPVTSLKALQTLRPTLKSIISIKSLSVLSDLFVRCGADKAGEFAWEQLQEAVLAHNSLHSLDQSLKLLPVLKILDLSNCELEDASALEFLPTVTFLDISHNQLRLVPRLSPAATYSLRVLIANNNLFSHIAGLHEMSNIEELDLRDNILSFKNVLSPISALPHIREIRLAGNPLAWDINYRSHLIMQLNPAAANHKVTIDNEPLTNLESAMVGSCANPSSSSYPTELLTSLSSLSSFCSPVYQYFSPEELSSPPTSLAQDSNVVQPSPANSQPSSLVHDTLSTSMRSLGNGQSRRKSRKKRTRDIAICDPEHEDWDTDSIHVADSEAPDRVDLSLTVSLLDGVPNPPPPSLAVGASCHPLNTDTVAEALSSLTLKTQMRTTAPEHSDKLLEEILQSKPQQLPVIKSNKEVNSLETETTDDAANLADDVAEETSETISANDDIADIEDNDKDDFNSPSMDSSLESSFYRESSKAPRHSSDVSPLHSDSEDEDLHSCLVKKEIEDQSTETARPPSEKRSEERPENGSRTSEDVIIAITPLHFKEKHAITTRTLFKWDLRTLESLELLTTSPHRILITFNTLRPAYKTRTYILDHDEYQNLSSVISPILERNTLQEVLHSAMMCLKCHTQFSRDLAQQPDGASTLKCPNCGGGVVVQVDKVDHPSMSLSGLYDGKLPRNSTPISQTMVRASQALGGAPPSGDSSESVSVCSEASSCVRRESDVEVISNPSVSSIEVLNDQQIIHDVILEEDGDEAKAPLPAAVNSDARTPANSPNIIHKPESTVNMQESSSSGSMTGSVCTTYEKAGSFPTSPVKTNTHLPGHLDTIDSKISSFGNMSSALYQTAESSLHSTLETGETPPFCSGSSPPHLSSSCTSTDTVKNASGTPAFHHKAVMTSIQDDASSTEEFTPRNLAAWVQSLLHTLTGYHWPWWEEVSNVEGMEKSVNPIHYSYEDFADIDHRLKLHCEVLLFHEPGEQLLGLIKAILLTKGGKREFQGILVISNKKIYVLEIVAEEDDTPKSWLELDSSHDLSEVQAIHSLYQRQGIALTLGQKVLLVSLADSHRSNCFYNFFSEILDDNDVTPDIVECSNAQEQALTEVVKNITESADGQGIIECQDTVISLFAIVSLLLDGGCSESQFLVMTDSDLFLFNANLEWYLPPAPDTKIKLNMSQKIANITAIELHSDSHLAIQFMEEVSGAETSWKLHVTSLLAASQIIEAIRTPWTQLFSVDLQDFIGVYRTKEGDLLSMTRMAIGGEARKAVEDSKERTPPSYEDWYKVSAVSGQQQNQKYPILGFSDFQTRHWDDTDVKDFPKVVEELAYSAESSYVTDKISSIRNNTTEPFVHTVTDECISEVNFSNFTKTPNRLESAPVFEENSSGDCNVTF